MIKQFRVRNYKALRDVTLDLTPIHVFIGPNDTGKTSILEALAALCRSVDHSIPTSFVGNWSGFDLVWQAQDELSVELAVSIEEESTTCQYGITCQFRRGGSQPFVVAERFEHDPADPDKLYKWEGQDELTRVHYQAFLRKKKTYIDEDGARLILGALSGVQYFRWDPRFLALPVAPDAQRQFRMESSGFGLAACLDDILGYDRDRFSALENRFKQVFPQFHSIILQRQHAYLAAVDDPKQVPLLRASDGKGIYFKFAKTGQVISASQVSDGVMLVLAYLTILNLPKPPRVLLIEEPENGVHPQRLEEVLKILRQLVEEHKHTQVLMTTHSPYVVDLFKPEEVTLCLRGDDGAVSVHRLSESETVRQQMKVFTLGEIWTSEGDDALGKSSSPSEAPKS